MYNTVQTQSLFLTCKCSLKASQLDFLSNQMPSSAKALLSTWEELPLQLQTVKKCITKSVWQWGHLAWTSGLPLPNLKH